MSSLLIYDKMISHALTIVTKELNKHLEIAYQASSTATKVAVGNLAEGIAGGTNGNTASVPRDVLLFSVVNLKEEKSLKNIPNYVRNDVRLTASYENPPVFLNLLILVSATHSNYTLALVELSRAIRFFQSRKVFTQDDVAPDSLLPGASDQNALDHLQSFKLIFDLYSPSLEEVNHLWGTLGGKQYPFVMYIMRLLDLKFKAVQSESGLITEVQSDFYHKNPVGN
jgi:hypothetical protein